MHKYVFFTDLDGTLLAPKSFSFKKAEKALDRIRETGSRLVICTSKTKSETIEYEERLRLKEPFIVENGSAIYIPRHYFTHDIVGAVSEGEYLVLRLGTSAAELEAVVDELAKEIDIGPFHSMEIKEIMKDTGLSAEQALKARDKQFIASFKLLHRRDVRKAEQFLTEKGYKMSKGGKFFGVMKGTDKGKAVKALMEHFKQEFFDVFSVGLGDAENDFEMLRACDKAFLVGKRGGNYASTEFERAPGIGPRGWNKAVINVLSMDNKSLK